jgi:hypothetical protein
MDEQPLRYFLLDRDGVINRRSSHGHPECWDKFEFLPRALDALRLLRNITTWELSFRTNRASAKQLPQRTYWIPSHGDFYWKWRYREVTSRMCITAGTG